MIGAMVTITAPILMPVEKVDCARADWEAITVFSALASNTGIM